MAAFGSSKVIYRITGPQSIERLDPLLKEFHFNLENATKTTNEPLTFVWETTCEKELRAKHKEAFILNKLNNTQILESKSSFAFLQLTMDRKFLECFVASNAAQARTWAVNRWNANESITDDYECDWWAIKASNGNGGKDIWIVNRNTYQKSLSELPANDEYVIQRSGLSLLVPFIIGYWFV